MTEVGDGRVQVRDGGGARVRGGPILPSPPIPRQEE